VLGVVDAELGEVGDGDLAGRCLPLDADGLSADAIAVVGSGQGGGEG
jgi:hypothetical protein